MGITLIIIYIVLATVTYAGTFAYLQRSYPSLAQEEYREDLAYSILFAFSVPFLGFVFTLFVTGFYKKGFKFF